MPKKAGIGEKSSKLDWKKMLSVILGDEAVPLLYFLRRGADIATVFCRL